MALDEALEEGSCNLQLILGEEHPDTAETFNNIGRVFFAQGDYEKALDYYRKVLAIFKRMLGEWYNKHFPGRLLKTYESNKLTTDAAKLIESCI